MKIAAAAVAALATIALAGCGGSNGNTTTSSSAGAGSGHPGVDAAYRFAACMRSHGVTNFPDPVVHTSGNSASVMMKIDPSISGVPAFKSAQNACQSILPGPNGSGPTPAQQHQRLETFLAFTHCLHTHGYPTFPDPQANGELNRTSILNSGVDVHTPQFFQTARSCLSVTKGAITPAQLSRGIASIPSR